MEAARIAADRGRDVTLIEREAELCGRVRRASQLPSNGELAHVTQFLTQQLKLTGVKVIPGKRRSWKTSRNSRPTRSSSRPGPLRTATARLHSSAAISNRSGNCPRSPESRPCASWTSWVSSLFRTTRSPGSKTVPSFCVNSSRAQPHSRPADLCNRYSGHKRGRRVLPTVSDRAWTRLCHPVRPAVVRITLPPVR